MALTQPLRHCVTNEESLLKLYLTIVFHFGNKFICPLETICR